MFRRDSGDIKKLLNSIDFSVGSKMRVKARVFSASKNELGMDELDAVAGGYNPESNDSNQNVAEIDTDKDNKI